MIWGEERGLAGSFCGMKGRDTHPAARGNCLADEAVAFGSPAWLVLLGGGGGAVGVEGAGEFLGNGGGVGGLDGGALHEVDELAVAQDGDGGRAGWVPGEVGAGALGGVAVLAGEDGDGLGGQRAVLQRHAHGGAHLAGGATADGVDHQHGGAGLGEGGVDFGGGSGFLDAGAGELFAHRDEHNLWVHGVPPGMGGLVVKAAVSIVAAMEAARQMMLRQRFEWGCSKSGCSLGA
jgi:hypothetical protein